MGGYGSGRRSAWRRYCVEDALAIRMSSIAARLPQMEPHKIYRLIWSKDGKELASIGVENRRGVLVLHYTLANKETRESCKHESFVPLTMTRCNYGGSRPWFICPCCSNRAGVLYLDTRGVGCRKCQGLFYWDENQGEAARRRHKIEKLKAQTGGGDILKKPKWMRWEKFSRLHQQLEALETADRERREILLREGFAQIAKIEEEMQAREARGLARLERRAARRRPRRHLVEI